LAVRPKLIPLGRAEPQRGRGAGGPEVISRARQKISKLRRHRLSFNLRSEKRSGFCHVCTHLAAAGALRLGSDIRRSISRVRSPWIAWQQWKYVSVVESGSFSGAARRLSKSVAQLEGRLTAPIAGRGLVAPLASITGVTISGSHTNDSYGNVDGDADTGKSEPRVGPEQRHAAGSSTTSADTSNHQGRCSTTTDAFSRTLRQWRFDASQGDGG
jgi:hypothetical protein